MGNLEKSWGFRGHPNFQGNGAHLCSQWLGGRGKWAWKNLVLRGGISCKRSSVYFFENHKPRLFWWQHFIFDVRILLKSLNLLWYDILHTGKSVFLVINMSFFFRTFNNFAIIEYFFNHQEKETKTYMIWISGKTISRRKKWSVERFSEKDNI